MNREQEIKSVKALGDAIGYGNLMWIASSLWRKSLKDQGYPVNGAFVPTINNFIKKTCQDNDSIATGDFEIEELFKS